MTQQQASNGANLLVQGRILWTSGRTLFEGQQSKNDAGQVVLDETGSPVLTYGFGLAIPKIDPRTGQPTAMYQQVWETLHREAFTLYPSGHLPPDFAMKYKDGDGIDHNGRPFADREGYTGHIILACTTRIPIKFFRFEGGNNMLVNDGIKCGDYVNVQLNIKAHPPKGRGKPGLYLNPSAVQLIQAGKEIINTPSGDQMFGNSAPVYQGEVVAPVAAPMPMQGMTPPMGAPAQAPAQHAYNPQVPAPVAQPYHNVLPQTFQPQSAPAPVAPQSYPQAAPMPMQGYPTQAPAPAPMSNGLPPMPMMPR